ncbi:MAG: VOC family protein [Algoriphagus aquaeductus]|uniref:VOC family protein n=1 Tax=Algoriphagus aquaeductus TaxID=475299 RepID=UPI003919A08C
MVFKGIDTLILRVKNHSNSAVWYQEKLGLTPIFSDDEIRLTVMDTGGPPSLTLWHTDEPIHNYPSTCAYPIFRTDNAAKSRDELISKGVQVTDLITDSLVTYFQFFDLDGNVLEACQTHD